MDSASLLRLGLELVGFQSWRIQRTRYKKNLSRFHEGEGGEEEEKATKIEDVHGAAEMTVGLLVV
jgi:hypothetical protein